MMHLVLIVCTWTTEGEMCFQFRNERKMEEAVCEVVKGMEQRRVLRNLEKQGMKARVGAACVAAEESA